MKLDPFLLDVWLEQKHDPDVGVRFDLASSVGPGWTVGSLAEAVGEDLAAQVLDVDLSYTPRRGTRAAREAVASFEGSDPEHVLLTTGASEAILLVLVQAAAPGANVLVPEPGYPAFGSVARMLGLEVRTYSLSEADGWSIDLEQVAQRMDERTAVVFVNSPHNPTGGVVTPAELDRLVELGQEHGARIVCDQVYHPVYHDADLPSAAGRGDVTVLGDASKALCMGGLRAGWVVEPDAARLEAYTEIRARVTITNAAVAQHLLGVVLRHAPLVLDRGRETARRNLALLSSFLEAHGEQLVWTRPRGGFTAFPRLLSSPDAMPFCRELLSRGVLVAPGAYVEGSAAHFRLGFGAEPAAFEQGLSRMGDVLEELPALSTGT